MDYPEVAKALIGRSRETSAFRENLASRSWDPCIGLDGPSIWRNSDDVHLDPRRHGGIGDHCAATALGLRDATHCHI